MRRSWQGQTAQMAALGIDEPYMRDCPTATFAPPYTALDHVVHAPAGENKTATMCHPLGEWLAGADRIAKAGETVTCNGCQRSIWKAEQRPARARGTQ